MKIISFFIAFLTIHIVMGACLTNNYNCTVATPAQCYSNCSLSCQNGTLLTFGDPTSLTCISLCPTGYFGDYIKGTCAISCTTNPRLYTYLVNNTCVPFCPSNSFLFSSSCVLVCTTAPSIYAFATVGNTNGTCVASCPNGNPNYYAQNISGIGYCKTAC
jgi:hypothetical protein